MRLFRKKPDYTYYSQYRPKHDFRFDSRKFIIGLGVLAVIVLIGYLNLTRIQLLWKGYSFSETSDILTLTREEEKLILNQDKLDDISTWIKLSDKVSYYDEYQEYLAIKPKTKKKEIVSFINDSFDKQVPLLKELHYNDDDVWKIISFASYDDLEYLTTKEFDGEEVREFIQYDSCVIKNMEKYISAYKKYDSYNYAINVVNYPFIISTNPVTTSYVIQDPENILELVKPGFELSADYEPSDLTHSNLGLTPECSKNDAYMREEAAKALNEMAKDAKKEGYTLLVNSAYRSYKAQQKIYKETEESMGGQYAADYVANPGVSEHQTGLGIDLKSQSAVDRDVPFGDTADGRWVRENCYKYGFIMRFTEGTSDITGILHEPWHVRYVGKEAAQKIHDNGYTFEEYCLYENIIPKLKVKE